MYDELERDIAPELLRAGHKRRFDDAFDMPVETSFASAPGDIYACGILLHSMALHISQYTDDGNQEPCLRNPPRNAVQLWVESAEVEDGLKEIVLAMTRDKSEKRPSAKQCLEMAWLCEDGKEHSVGFQFDSISFDGVCCLPGLCLL